MPVISRLFLAPPQLSSCLFGAIYRNTLNADLTAENRVNHFPASALVTVTLLQRGKLVWLPLDGDWSNLANLSPLPRISVFPPTDAPVSSWAEGGVEAISFGVYPDAWLQLGGTADYCELPEAFTRAIEAYLECDEPEEGWKAFCDDLTSTSVIKRQGYTSVSDWARALIVRASMTGRGRSLRALERRLKRFSGHTKRALEFYASFDNLHYVSRTQRGSSLAEIAVEAGYADQSHMGRAVRRATGFSPARLNKAIETEEPFWFYRLIGERY